MNPKVSIVVPTYNEEKVIGSCLETLNNQSYQNFEILVVDDGSTDKTSGVVKSLKSQYSNLRFLSQYHQGPGEARNLGAKHANGTVLVFVDSDMTFDKDFIKNLVQPIITGKLKGTFSKDEYVSNWENIWSRCWNINEGWETRRRHRKNYPDTQKVFRAISKSEFDRVGGFASGGHYTDDYLSEKLGYEAEAVSGAEFYHANPDNLKEVFAQSKWAAKREYKLGLLGVLFSLIRTSLPVSLIIGLVKSLVNIEPRFLVFKVVYDFGIFVGLLEIIFTDKHGK